MAYAYHSCVTCTAIRQHVNIVPHTDCITGMRSPDISASHDYPQERVPVEVGRLELLRVRLQQCCCDRLHSLMCRFDMLQVPERFQ